MADLEVEQRDAIWIVRLNRPAQNNAFTLPMVDEWSTVLTEFDRDPAARALITTATGNRFSAGLDVANDVPVDAPVGLNHEVQKRMHRLGLAMQRVTKPTLAAINGAAIGAGMDVALQSDIRLMAESATLVEGYIRAGLVPGNGGGYYLPRIVGTARALELLWTARTLNAAECLEWGIVSYVVPDDQLMSETIKLAETIAGQLPSAVRAIKSAVYESASTDLPAALDAMATQMAVVQASPESKALVAALRARRAAAERTN